MGRVKRIWYLSPMRAAKVQASLRIRAVSPEPPLLAHISSESRGTFRQKARSHLNGWACAVKTCHDGMLEDTNSLDAAHMISVWRYHYTVIMLLRSSRDPNHFKLLYNPFQKGEYFNCGDPFICFVPYKTFICLTWLITVYFDLLSVVDCGDSYTIEHGHVNFTGHLTTFNQTVPVVCNVGYNLVGASNIACGSDGSWSTDTHCQAVGKYFFISSPEPLCSLVSL